MPEPFFAVNISRIENDPQKIKDALERILSRSEFSSLKSNWLRETIQKTLEAIKDWKITQAILDFLSSVGKFLSSLFQGNTAQSLLFVFSFLLMAGLIFFIVIKIRKRVKFSMNLDDKAGGEAHKDHRITERIAREKAEEGDFVQAISNLYLSLLLWLDARGVVEFSRSRTNRELERLVSSKGGTRFIQQFSKLNGLFEKKIYAMSPCTSEDFQNFLDLYEGCKREVGAIE